MNVEIKENLIVKPDLFKGDRWVLPANDLSICRKTPNEIENRFIRAGWDQELVFDMMPGISDLFWNAVIHGSYGVDKKDKESKEELWLDVIKRLKLVTNKKVTVILNIQPDYMEITFQDEGPGYDPDEKPTDFEPEGEELFSATGKGKKVIQEMGVFDEVVYDKSNKSVTLKREKVRLRKEPNS